MDFTELDLGFVTADAEDVELQYDGADLSLKFLDYRERSIRHQFLGVLAFKWAQDPGDGDIRGDRSYVQANSEWLAREAKLAGESPDDFVHYKLCFNACGVLDVLLRRDDDG